MTTTDVPTIDVPTIVRCYNCGSSQFCLPFTLNKHELDRLEKIIIRRAPIQKGQLLFQAGNKLTGLYAIRSGMVKNYTIVKPGEEQISAFYSTGDLVGFDAINTLIHPSSARVLDTSLVCEIPFEPLEQLSSQMPPLRRQLLRLMSQQIKKNQEQISLLSRKNAKERLATFIYTLTRSAALRGFSPNTLQLSMSRTDIGNYLGLTIETISRLLGALQSSGILAVKGRFITVLDNNKLMRITNEYQPMTHTSFNKPRGILHP